MGGSQYSTPIRYLSLNRKIKITLLLLITTISFLKKKYKKVLLLLEKSLFI